MFILILSLTRNNHFVRYHSSTQQTSNWSNILVILGLEKNELIYNKLQSMTFMSLKFLTHSKLSKYRKKVIFTILNYKHFEMFIAVFLYLGEL